jgi:hypothetical protein
LLRAIARKKAAGFTLEQWRYAFTNTFTEEESKALCERYHIPGQYGCCGQCAGHPRAGPPGHLRQLRQRRPGAAAVHLRRRGPHLMPPSVQRSNAKHYKSNTVTEVKEYLGYAHFLPAQKGWEQIADDALAWAVEHAW